MVCLSASICEGMRFVSGGLARLRQQLQDGRKHGHHKNLLAANQQVGLREMLVDAPWSNTPFLRMSTGEKHLHGDRPEYLSACNRLTRFRPPAQPSWRIWTEMRLEIFNVFCAEANRCQFAELDLSHWFSTRQVCAQEGKPFSRPPTWRYRVLKTALGLRPGPEAEDRALRGSILEQNDSQGKIPKKVEILLTNHIPVHLRLNFLNLR